MYWPIVLLTSVMMFDAPGSENDLANILTVILVVAYPIYIFGFYALFKAPFFKLPAQKCLKFTTAIVLGAMILFGYFELLWEAL